MLNYQTCRTQRYYIRIDSSFEYITCTPPLQKKRKINSILMLILEKKIKVNTE